MVGVERRVGQLVEPAREAVHVTGADHSADHGRGDPGTREFGQTRNPLLLKETVLGMIPAALRQTTQLRRTKSLLNGIAAPMPNPL